MSAFQPALTPGARAVGQAYGRVKPHLHANWTWMPVRDERGHTFVALTLPEYVCLPTRWKLEEPQSLLAYAVDEYLAELAD